MTLKLLQDDTCETKRSVLQLVCPTLTTDTPSLQNSGRSADPSLTAKGFQQAEALGRFVGDELGEACGKVEPQHAIRRMVVSPMRRCMLTAGPAAKVLGRASGNRVKGVRYRM